ncbi:phenazine biosynthesis FMN-dependent oxidase PhzG [Streptomyces sp. NPDC005408]|uniref:phenazine biosynthesis FMN-dependent oxidase PhzG n=1 Tax=Streptomyces sp. NPDC005408 TaxID=3155341 RepID=UPI0033B92AE1
MSELPTKPHPGAQPAAVSESLTATVDIAFPEYTAPPPDPIALLRSWLRDAHIHGVREPRALALATADSRRQTSIRTVVVNRLTESGLVFTTHRTSLKARELRENPWASGLLYWRETSQQISLSGPVRQLPDADTDALWAERPVFTHAMTTASRQSEPLDDVAALRARAHTLAQAGPQPRPPTYIALELLPHTVEFWANGTDRLHERLRYDRTPAGWNTTRLQP